MGEDGLDLSRWAALCEVVWFENLSLMSQRASKRIAMGTAPICATLTCPDDVAHASHTFPLVGRAASEPFSGNQLMFDTLRYMHRVHHRLEALKRRRKHSVPFSDVIQQGGSSPHGGDAAPAATVAPQDPSEGESVRGSERPVRKEDVAETSEQSAADAPSADYRGHKAVHRFQLFYQLTLDTIQQYELASKELASRFSSASLGELDERIKTQQAKLDGLKVRDSLHV